MAHANVAHAAVLTNTYLRLNRMKTGTATSFRLVFTNITASTNSVVVDFNGVIDTGIAQWTNATPGGLIGATGSQTASISTCPSETGTTGIPGTLTGSSSGSTITVATTGTMSATTAYCVDLTFASAVTTPTVAGEYHPSVTTKTGGSATDSTNIALRIIANDQIGLSAIVPPIFTFVLGSTSLPFSSNLSLSNTIGTAGDTITITTNAATGWITWVKGTNTSTSGTANYGALKSPTASNYTIPSNATGTLGAAAHFNTPGTEDYGLGVTSKTDAAGGGTVSIDAAYDSSANPTCTTASTCKIGGVDTSQYRQIGSATGTASGSGDVLTFAGRADISGATPAATDYADTWTVVGAGKF